MMPDTWSLFEFQKTTTSSHEKNGDEGTSRDAFEAADVDRHENLDGS
jgi:hypothetical protein